MLLAPQLSLSCPLKRNVVSSVYYGQGNTRTEAETDFREACIRSGDSSQCYIALNCKTQAPRLGVKNYICGTDSFFNN